MHGKEILTEYFEEGMDQPKPKLEDEVVFIEAPMEKGPALPGPGEAYVVSFSEDDMPVAENNMEFVHEDEVADNAKADDMIEEDEAEDAAIDEVVFEEEDMMPQPAPEPTGRFMPGVEGGYLSEEKEPEVDEADDEPVETNWVDDRDTSKFMDYLRDAYSQIPRHNGMSISGCERALVYLNGLNREVSEAVRKDSGNSLDEHLDEIEDYRVKIIKGMVALKTRIGELKKKIKEEGSQKRASDESDDLTKEGAFQKEATTAQIQLVMTPFERAITGIIVNAVVSGGKPFEEVYDYLKDKFDLTSREELAILQIIMDMGYPIFKDRGTIGGEATGDNEGHGIDFIKNYLA